jgi:hypothetical protein
MAWHYLTSRFGRLSANAYTNLDFKIASGLVVSWYYRQNATDDP